MCSLDVLALLFLYYYIIFTFFCVGDVYEENMAARVFKIILVLCLQSNTFFYYYSFKSFTHFNT